MHRVVSRLGSARLGVGLASAAATLTAATARAEPEPPTEPPKKPQSCLQLTLLTGSTAAALAAFPAAHARVIGDRVLVRPCMTRELESLPLRPLAVVDDGASQSLLLAIGTELWEGAADASTAGGGVGYPVLPVSIADEAPPAPPRTLPGPNGEATGAPPPAAKAEPAAPVPTLWEQVEEPWRQLEAAGVLRIERDADAMPTAVALTTGGVEWSGKLAGAAGRPSRTVRVLLVGRDFAEKLGLSGRTAAPECGFCKFMKAGPCGKEFVAWEACIDAAKESGKDFVDLCGKPTLALKTCTDAHPEYYGELMGDDEPPPKESKPVAAA